MVCSYKTSRAFVYSMRSRGLELDKADTHIHDQKKGGGEYRDRGATLKVGGGGGAD